MPRPGPSVTSGADLQPGSDSLFPSGFTGGGARPSAGSVGTSEIADGSVSGADLNLASVTAALNGTYASISSAKQSITYNGDGTVNTVTETATGAVTTYSYNADGTVATESRVLNGVTALRTFAYTGGNLTGVS